MAKPKAPEWLRLAFRDGVDERYEASRFDIAAHGGRREGDENSAMLYAAYPGADIACWLAQHDERRRSCSGRLERAHLIPRQRVENALGALLQSTIVGDPSGGVVTGRMCDDADVGWFDPADLILLAAWDPRNGVVVCEHHHRRFDSHATPPLIVPQSALPAHAFEFANEWGLDNVLNDRFPLHLP